MSASYDVFISYARVDTVRARLIREKLAALGLNVFFDTEGIDTGEEFPVIIDRAVKGARCVLGLWSRAAFNGRWVRIESRIGLDQRKLVAGFVDFMRPEELPAEFYNVNVEPLGEFRGQDDHEGWQRVLRSIGKKLGRGDLGRTPQAAAADTTTPTRAAFEQAVAKAKEIPPIYMIGAALAIFAIVGLANVGGGDGDRLEAAASRFSGSRVFTPGAASAATNAALDLSGAWTGTFREAGRDAPFRMTLRTSGDGAFTGEVSEPNTFGLPGANDYQAQVRGQARGDGTISLTKTYDGAGGLGHSVQYEGRIEDGGRTITGTWRTTAQSGDFRMERD